MRVDWLGVGLVAPDRDVEVSPDRDVETVGTMRTRRPLAGLFITLTLFGGGGAALAACGDPVNSTTGTPRDTASNTGGSGTYSSGVGVPDNSNQTPGATTPPNNGG
jgi:hypothetical protein